MFPRERRLRRYRDIQLVLRRGHMVRVPGLSLRYRRTNAVAYPRATVVVGTVVAKRATVRNRLKRHLRQLLVRDLNNIKGGFDFMLTAHPPILTLPIARRRILLQELLRRARLNS